MDADLWMTFPALEALPGFAHRFTLRHPEIDVNAERAVVVEAVAVVVGGAPARPPSDAVARAGRARGVPKRRRSGRGEPEARR